MPQKDPLTEKAVRRGNEWLFVSFDGIVHPIDVSGRALALRRDAGRSLDDADRAASWRIGGSQHLAVHAASRAGSTSLMHQGGRDTHKEAGTEIWVYDLAARKRVQRIPVVNPLASFVRVTGALDRRRGSAARWVLEKTLPNHGRRAHPRDAGRASRAGRGRRRCRRPSRSTTP